MPARSSRQQSLPCPRSIQTHQRSRQRITQEDVKRLHALIVIPHAHELKDSSNFSRYQNKLSTFTIAFIAANNRQRPAIYHPNAPFSAVESWYKAETLLSYPFRRSAMVPDYETVYCQ
jgi:hypothetical protein